MYKTFSMELAGRTLSVDVGRVAAQANGAAFMHYGETTVLSTATASEKPREGIDFFPLSVEFEEKLYAVGKIPGGFNKREGKASENSVLTSRVIDRPMRPLFPKDYRNDVTLNNLVLSVDPECRPELVAMIGSAIATCISDIPFAGPCAMTQVGMIDGEFIINPTQEQWKKGDLQLTVASTSEKVIMIEAGANEVPEAVMIDAIYKAHDVNQTLIEFINKIVGGAIPKEYIPAVGEGIEEATKAGILGGFPVLGVHANVYDGSYHEVDSSEMAFHIAGSLAFKEAMQKAAPVLLEPIMKVEVTMPEEYMGDVIGDINSRRGRIEGMEDIGGGKMVKAYVPLAEMFGYSTDLRSKTQGRGNYSMFFEKYEQVPKSVQDKVLAARAK